MQICLCAASDLPLGTSLGFDDAAPYPVFAVHGDAGIVVYRNACPHLGVPLEWAPNRFLSLDGHLIVCGTHGAEFRIHDGYCQAGPCRGKSLQKIAHAIDNGQIVIDIPEQTP